MRSVTCSAPGATTRVARYDYILNVLRLKRSAGTLSEDDLATIQRLARIDSRRKGAMAPRPSPILKRARGRRHAGGVGRFIKTRAAGRGLLGVREHPGGDRTR